MKNFLYENLDTGDYIYVQAESEEESYSILEEVVGAGGWEFTGIIDSDEVADAYGYDTI